MLKITRIGWQEAYAKCDKVATAYECKDNVAYDLDDLYANIKRICKDNSNQEEFEVALFLVPEDVYKLIGKPQFMEYYNAPEQKEVFKCGYLGNIDLTDGTVGGSNCICHMYIDREHPHSTLRWYGAAINYGKARNQNG